MPSVRLLALGEAASQARHRFLDSLSDVGVEVCSVETPPPACTACVLFDDPSSAVCARVCELSHGGRDRVLAVAAAAGELPSSAVWRLLHAGANDVLAWSGRAELIDLVRARLQRWEAVDAIVSSALVVENLVGRSTGWIKLLRRVVELARFTDAGILLLGESGTGKEQVARLVHTLDSRERKGQLIVVDCTTIVPELSGSEFFGHERGAFTGAVSPRDGAFALANGGTLFIDEIGELPLALQAQLLRAVQEHSYKRVGGNAWNQTNFRLLCATNRDLADLVRQGEFRRDLYYRIATASCTLPPLRDRVDDILLLARHFIREQSGDAAPPDLDPVLLEWLLQRDYPGNIRDLRQVICRIMSRHTGAGPLTPGHVPEEDRPAVDWEPPDWRDESFERSIRRAVESRAGLKEIGRAVHETAIRLAVASEAGSLHRAAEKLKVSDRLLQLERAAWRRRQDPRPG